MPDNSRRKHFIKIAVTELKAASLAALWLCLVTCPILVFRINATTGKIDFLWNRLSRMALYAFLGTLAWRFLLRRRTFSHVSQAVSQAGGPPPVGGRGPKPTWVDLVMGSRYRRQGLIALLLALFSVPVWASPYLVNIITGALIYITLGLGLNVVVGVSGLLNLGYVAFYAVGAYVYALLSHYFGLGFWICLPLGALSATVLGLLLGLPVIRLSGDYLAIVTLGFAEIVRLVLVNSELTRGPRGIGNIPQPGFFGLDLEKTFKPWMESALHMNPAMDLNKVFLYFIILAVVVLTIVCVFRLENSRLGRAWLALREDEVACQAMGINRTRAKLTAFALGSTWAGLAGVVFASQVTFINPTSFTFMQSVMILSIVVLGGMGSIPGVIVGAAVLILLPESLRQFKDYRMLLFGGLMVVMMVFRPGGLIQSVRQVYVHRPAPEPDKPASPGEAAVAAEASEAVKAVKGREPL
jgi:branched-chain amino acid transport system permease protein